jgi:nitrilase
MLDQDVELIAVPSAFTAFTGKAHWEILVRVRAIENQCYGVAAAQGGMPGHGRETSGASMIVDPWGVVLGRRARGAGLVSAEYDREHLARIRRNFPAVSHRRVGAAASG